MGRSTSHLRNSQIAWGPCRDCWCGHGYAVVNPDAHGIAHSEGDITMIGTQEAEDACDLIEWVAAQPWCNGKVALTGCSYLAFSQWFIAAEQPPHLAAINLHEGLSDGYRDFAFRGWRKIASQDKWLRVHNTQG